MQIGQTSGSAGAAASSAVSSAVSAGAAASSAVSSGSSAGPCVDYVPPNQERWHDADGAFYTCAWYASGATYCRYYGSSYSNFGQTASQACCVCGGGGH